MRVQLRQSRDMSFDVLAISVSLRRCDFVFFFRLQETIYRDRATPERVTSPQEVTKQIFAYQNWASLAALNVTISL